MSANKDNGYDQAWLNRVLTGPKRFDGPQAAPTPAHNGRTMHDGQQPWLTFRDHEIAQVVNELRRIALDFGGSQQLRERISQYIVPILKGERRP